MYASILGAGLSDGHVAKHDQGFIYTESDSERVEIFNNQVRRFGDVYSSECIEPNGVLRTRYSSTFGRALESRGLISGDKSLQNRGFPDWLKNASSEVLREYYSPMWAQEANFKTRIQDNRGEFQWDRGVAFHDPSKQKSYNYHSSISDKHIGLFMDYGTRKDSTVLGPHRVITYGRLEELTKHPDEQVSITASELKLVAFENQSELLNDEIAGLGKLGIGASPYLSKVTYYEESGRVSSLWHASTKTSEDAMRAAILTPPEDVIKRDKVEKWVGENQELAERIRKNLLNDGFLESHDMEEQDDE
ncbi:MAG: hypothetical protein ACXAEF_13620 [Candidatus Thorarchaeota archaeon]|jgi:hypothetical protein